MILSESRHLLIAAFIINIGMVTGGCQLYDTLDWSDDDINFKKISGLYSVITTNIAEIFGACEIHGLTQETNGDIVDRYKVDGSPCPSVFQNRITKTAPAFQYEFFGDDPTCLPSGNLTNDLKMKVLPDGSCFFKSFCLSDGRAAVNLLCQNPNTSLLDLLLTPVLNTVLKLLGSSVYRINQSCYNKIVNNQTNRAMLLE